MEVIVGKFCILGLCVIVGMIVGLMVLGYVIEDILIVYFYLELENL